MGLECDNDRFTLRNRRRTEAAEAFSIAEALRFGWSTVQTNFVLFIILLTLAGLALSICDFIVESAVVYVSNRFSSTGMLYVSDFIPSSVIRDISEYIAELFVAEGGSDLWNASHSISTMLGGISVLLVISVIVFLFLCMLVRMWLISVSLKFCDDEKGWYSDIFSSFRLYPSLVVGWILYLLIVLLGTCLFVIPGIIWGVKFRLFPYAIVDRRLDAVAALKKSWAITTGIKWRVLMLSVILGLLNVIGAFCFGVGLFATIPTTILAGAFTYRRLLVQAEAAPTFQTWPRVTRRKVGALLVLLGVFVLYCYAVLYPEVDYLLIEHAGLYCRTNLRKVTEAIDTYRQDHEGSLPLDLDTLCAASYLEERDICCPSAISEKSAKYEYIHLKPGEADKYTQGTEIVPFRLYPAKSRRWVALMKLRSWVPSMELRRRQVMRERKRKEGERIAIVQDSDARNHGGFGRNILMYHSDGGRALWACEENPIKLTVEERKR